MLSCQCGLIRPVDIKYIINAAGMAVYKIIHITNDIIAVTSLLFFFLFLFLRNALCTIQQTLKETLGGRSPCSLTHTLGLQAADTVISFPISLYQ